MSLTTALRTTLGAALIARASLLTALPGPALAQAASEPAAAPAAPVPAAARRRPPRCRPRSPRKPSTTPRPKALWLQGDFVAKATLIIMIIMSMGSWYVISPSSYEQRQMLKRPRQSARHF